MIFRFLDELGQLETEWESADLPAPRQVYPALWPSPPAERITDDTVVFVRDEHGRLRQKPMVELYDAVWDAVAYDHDAQVVTYQRVPWVTPVPEYGPPV